MQPPQAHFREGLLRETTLPQGPFFLGEPTSLDWSFHLPCNSSDRLYTLHHLSEGLSRFARPALPFPLSPAHFLPILPQMAALVASSCQTLMLVSASRKPNL